jgi:folate-binding protein YgfZ
LNTEKTSTTEPGRSAEYSAVRENGAGLIDLSRRGRILVSGSEAVMFLNGLITNDIKNLARDSWMLAAFANVQGRLLATVRMFPRDDGFLLDTSDATREKIIGLLERFVLAGDFRVTDLTDELVSLSVQGPRASQVVAAVFGEEAARLPRQKVANLKFGEAQVPMIRATWSAEDGFDLFVEASVAPQLREVFAAGGAVTVDEATAETLRIEAGIPLYGIDMDETTIVTETNLDDAVSFSKGCYLGQEIIVRIKHRGHVAKKLAGLVLETTATVALGAKVFSADGPEIGRITSSTVSPRLDRTIALGYVKYDYLTPATQVIIAAGDQRLPAKVTELPFVRGTWYDESEPEALATG